MASPRRPVSPMVPFAFEAALGGVGALIAWIGEVPLLEKLWPESGLGKSLVTGLLATLPLLLLLALLVNIRLRPFADLLRKVRGLLRVLLVDARWWQIAAVALAAGFGEEVLFRGAIQPIAVRWLTPLGGLVATSLLFGVVHAATPTYFLFATVVGLYLGGITLWTDEILSASIAHALYDYIAIRYLLRRRGCREGLEEVRGPGVAL